MQPYFFDIKHLLGKGSIGRKDGGFVFSLSPHFPIGPAPEGGEPPIGFGLLPEKFTLAQLQNLYEVIYETSFDKRNFLRKIWSLEILIKLDGKEKSLSKRGSFYYRFDHKKYATLKREGIQFI
jgi:hypothetical protein